MSIDQFVAETITSSTDRIKASPGNQLIFLLDDSRCCSYDAAIDAAETLAALGDHLYDLNPLANLRPLQLDSTDPMPFERQRGFLQGAGVIGVWLQVKPARRSVRGWWNLTSNEVDGKPVRCAQ